MNEYKYALTSDNKQYNIVKKLDAVNVHLNYYKYEHNYTQQDISKFICNNNL